MANMFEDLASSIITGAGNTFGTAVSATGALTAVDFVDAGNNRISAIVTTTAVAGAGTADIKIQESTDNSTWTDLTNPVTATAYVFPQLNAANQTQFISFNVNKRYVRGYATIGGTSVTLQLTFMAQRKVSPANTPGWINETGPA